MDQEKQRQMPTPTQRTKKHPARSNPGGVFGGAVVKRGERMGPRAAAQTGNRRLSDVE